MKLLRRQPTADVSPSAAIMQGFRTEPQFGYYTDEEIAELCALMERDAKIDLGLYDPEPTPAPDVDEGDGPEPLSFAERLWMDNGEGDL